MCAHIRKNTDSVPPKLFGKIFKTIVCQMNGKTFCGKLLKVTLYDSTYILNVDGLMMLNPQ